MTSTIGSILTRRTFLCWCCNPYPIHALLISRRNELLETNSSLPSVSQARICRHLNPSQPMASLSLRLSHWPPPVKANRKTQVDHDELAGVPRNSFVVQVLQISPHQLMPVVPIRRRGPICLTYGPALPSMSQTPFSRHASSISQISHPLTDSFRTRRSSWRQQSVMTQLANPEYSRYNTQP